MITTPSALPKISIITPSFNQANYIEQTICSVLDQEYPNLEYIIIDGGSVDRSPEIINKYSKYLSYWISEPDRGQSHAINKGYLNATGDVLNWLNSDDYYEPGALKIVGEAFQNPSLNVFCGISRVFGNGHEYYSGGTDIYEGNLEKTMGWARIDQPETFMRKRVWDEVGPVDQRFHYLMDKELWIRYLQTFGLNSILKTKDLLVHFRHHKDSKTVSQQAGFGKEAFDLYYSIAIETGLKEEAAFFTDNFHPKYIPLNYTFKNGNVKRLMHYFFLYQFEEAYALNNRAWMETVNRYLRPSVLSVEDQKRYQWLMWRSRIIPMRIKKWWNKA